MGTLLDPNPDELAPEDEDGALEELIISLVGLMLRVRLPLIELALRTSKARSCCSFSSAFFKL